MKLVRRVRQRNRNRPHTLHLTREQARLDGEMFDSVTQSLFSLTLMLRAARLGLPQARVPGDDQGGDEAKRLLDSAEELAQHALSDMCGLTFEMRPEAREQAGLVSALQTHTRSLQARSGLKIHLSVKGDRRFPFELEEALYQITRFALREVVRQGQATEAWVELDLEGNKVYISIRDNSPGSTDFTFSLSSPG